MSISNFAFTDLSMSDPVKPFDGMAAGRFTDMWGREVVYNNGMFWVTQQASAVGRMMGSARSPRKSASSAANGRKGGRPRKD